MSKTVFFTNDDNMDVNVVNLFKNFTRSDVRVIWVKGNTITHASLDFSSIFSSKDVVSKILLIFEDLPVKPDILKNWREWALEKKASDIRILFYEDAIEKEGFIKNALGNWFNEKPEKEPCAVNKGSWVSMAGKKTQKGDPSLLTIQFGKAGELLSHLDWVKRRFNSPYRNDENSKKYRDSISKALSDKKCIDSVVPVIEHSLDLIPRILLLGETGVGKTLFARYLAGNGRFIRISIPEYLNKEDMFEYDLFGYASGAYTDGKKEGSLGILLEHFGGVVFLDEIGEASPIIQAKLLAFLDDYKIRPRGWTGDGFYCPLLIVGASNRPMTEDKDTYRNDLLQRFTDVQTIPPLRDRKENFPMLLDCLLQNPGINIDGFITMIGKDAYALLFNKEYRDGNFRELENIVRNACFKARMDGRNYLVKTDFL